MKFTVERVFPGVSPRDVYAAFRDFAPKHADRLPNVKAVEVLEDDGRTRKLKWQAVGDVPRAAHRWIKPEDLYWYEDGDWDPDALEARYRLHRPGIGWFHADAHFRVHEEGDGARLQCEVDLRVELPLVGGLLEKAFVKEARKNFEQSLDAMEREAPWKG